ncbi:alpha/beta-hydrolase [Mycena capillaripes]|nr:alpha/beta-hydrolase [Mycena capillaripes]
MLGVIWVLSSWRNRNSSQSQAPDPFYVKISSPKNICPASGGPAISHSGYIGLRGDSNAAPKRSFFWYFEAEHDVETAPVILAIGGGPGTSGMMNLLAAQGPCLIVENGTVPNPNRWTEHFNLIALDHPVGVGNSYGAHVNNSRDAALDVYDFFQKFYRVFPHLVQNQLILSSGSYGGIYVPHIATVIHEQNLAIAAGKGPPGAVHINLESMMISNPVSDALSHFGWLLHTRCYLADIYNATTCAEMYALLPACLDSIRLAYEAPKWSVQRHAAANELCAPLDRGDTHGTVLEDIRKKCYSADPMACLPASFEGTGDFFHRSDIKDALGIPTHVNFTAFNPVVSADFKKYGDIIQPAYLLYGPLLAAGIRLLHYIGAQDANCALPGVLSFLKRIQSPFQEAFLHAPDIPWPNEGATVRAIGHGAGNMTYIRVDQAGHFAAQDQPRLVKTIVEHWVENVPFGAR